MEGCFPPEPVIHPLFRPFSAQIAHIGLISDSTAPAAPAGGHSLARRENGGTTPEEMDMFTIKRLNHAVLWVRDARRAGAFYRQVLGFEVVESLGEKALFLRANGSDNHHDLGLFSIGDQAPPPSRG